MILKPDDRVLVKPLGVKGTVVRLTAVGERLVAKGLPGGYLVQADSGGPSLPWHESELEKLTD